MSCKIWPVLCLVNYLFTMLYLFYIIECIYNFNGKVMTNIWRDIQFSILCHKSRVKYYFICYDIKCLFDSNITQRMSCLSNTTPKVNTFRCILILCSNIPTALILTLEFIISIQMVEEIILIQIIFLGYLFESFEER